MDDVSKLLTTISELESSRQYTRALSYAQKGLRKHPGDHKVALTAGRLLITCKQGKEALGLFKSLYERGKASGKQDFGVLLGLARSSFLTGNYKQATGIYSQLFEKAAINSDVLAGLAGCKRVAGNLDEAEELARKAVSVAPGHKIAVHELAQVLIEKKSVNEALELLESNIRTSDVHADSIDLWMGALSNLDRNRYAQDTLESLSKDFPNILEFIYGFASLANRAGETSLARPAYEKAIELSPQNPRIYYDLGVLERVAGNLDRARELINQSLNLRPDSPAALRTFGADVKYEYGDDNFKRLNFVVAKFGEFPESDQIHLHYALAKAFEDVGELDTAFRHYEIGGGKKRKVLKYDERASVRLFDLIPRVVTKANLDDTKQVGFKSQQPVFILGMPRSGTSLMEQILSSHPDVFGAGELKFLTGILENIPIGEASRLRLGDKEPYFNYDDQASWELRGQRFVEKLQKLADKPYERIVDKMPGNFNFVGLIHAILPEAKIIHSRRHPVETCLSCYRIHFAEGHHWSYNLGQLGRFYKRYWNLMNHWRTEFPGVMHEVRYEDNVADVEGQARSLIDYLGLEWNENCLNFYNTERPVKTASVTQVRKPIYTTSTNRWRKYEKFLGPLLEELGDIVPEYEAEIAHLAPKP